jgi:pyridoxine 5-phosphate synthase
MILSINIDHVATLRNARGGHEPDPVMAATLAILGGADSITLHLREDRRHVNDRDLRLLREVVKTELNLEMAATEEMTSIALSLRPDLVTIVPEKRQELTTEGGIDLFTSEDQIKNNLSMLKEAGIPVSVFINPEIEDVEKAHSMGFDMVEIHTGFYANAKGENISREYQRILNAINRGKEISIPTNVGHGLNYFNVKPIAAIKGIRGLYIGHSIISRAVLVGLQKAVRDMKALLYESTLC